MSSFLTKLFLSTQNSLEYNLTWLWQPRGMRISGKWCVRMRGGGGYGVFIDEGATNSLKSIERPGTMECTSGTIYSLVQRVSRMYKYYPMVIPKVTYIHVVPRVRPYTIYKHMSGGPLTYVHTRNRSVRLPTLAYVY
jgi:hypothetical protein